jgi:hypothetical protein
MPRKRLPRIIQKYTKKQKKPEKNREEISGCVRLGIVNKRLNSIIVT